MGLTFFRPPESRGLTFWEPVIILARTLIKLWTLSQASRRLKQSVYIFILCHRQHHRRAATTHGCVSVTFPRWWAQQWAAGDCRILVIVILIFTGHFLEEPDNTGPSPPAAAGEGASASLFPTQMREAEGCCRRLLHAKKCHFIYMHGRPT